MHSRSSEGRRCRRTAFVAALALAATVAVPVGASAYDWQSGDVFVGLSSGQYNVYDNGGTLHETINQASTGPNHYAVDCAFDRAGVLHTTAYTVPAIDRFLGPAPHNPMPQLTGLSAQPESISFARDGSFYVGHIGAPSLLHFTGGGALLASFNPAAPASLIDLAADQRTIFYTDRSLTAPPVIHRFDVATNANLPDFANLGGTARSVADLKLLPPGDGSAGLIVAQGSEIKRLDGNGNVVQRYDVPGEDSWFGIALDPDGKSFWAQTNAPGNVYRFDIASGAVDRGPLPAAAAAYGICVKGTRLAALDNAAPSISVTTPAEGARFVQGQAVAASYACADDRFGTGIASCGGPVPSGAALDTGSVGTKSFKVDAADVAGNTAGFSRTYTVVAPTPGTTPGRVLVSVSFRYAASDKATRLTSFTVKNIPSGARLQVSCAPKQKGAKCPVKKVTKKHARGTVKLKRFIGPKFRRGTVITVQVTKPGMVGAVKLVTIRKRNGPSTSTSCLPPSARKPVKCS